MPFDPAADPWGTAMLASAGLWVLAATVVVISWFARTSARTGGNLMIVALLGFLVSAGGGTWERIKTNDALAAKPPPPDPTVIVAPPPVPDPDQASASTGADAGSSGSPAVDRASADASSGDTGAAETGDTGAVADDAATGGSDSGDTGAPADAGDTGPADEGGETGEPDASDDGGSLPAVEPLPSDPDARKDALRKLLREAAAVADSARRCSSLDEVASAWAQLRTVPSEAPWAKQAGEVAKRLDGCRRKLLYSASRRRRREQIDARDAFAAGLAERMQTEHEIRVAVSISGNSHERLRVGGKGLDAAKAESLMDGGLRKELQELGFANVVLSDGTTPLTFKFETPPESELGLPDLRAVGLGEPLTLPSG